MDNQQGVIAHRTVLGAMWPPGWKVSLGENGSMNSSAPSLFTRNYHSIVHQLDPNTK